MLFEEIKASFKCKCGKMVVVWITKHLEKNEFYCSCGRHYQFAPLEDNGSATILSGTKYHHVSASVFHAIFPEDA